MIKQICYKYKKKDGNIRIIKCYENTISYFKPNGTQKKYRDNDHTHLILWDIEKKSWKTLILENIIEKKTINLDINNKSYIKDYESFIEILYYIYCFIVIGVMWYFIYDEKL
tara:strand:- start:94 stop:429 length:336 start_codon:yes stop_codon:yes gene_type:complete